jgi:hypothetical protein
MSLISHASLLSYIFLLTHISIIIGSACSFTYLLSQPIQVLAQSKFPDSIIMRTSLSTEPVPLGLKAIGDVNGKISEVGGFKQELTNIVATRNNSELYVFSSELIEKVKIGTPISKTTVDLQKIGFNTFHIANLPTGIYTLDVIAAEGKTKAIYEGLLMIGFIPYETLQHEVTERNSVRDVFSSLK